MRSTSSWRSSILHSSFFILRSSFLALVFAPAAGAQPIPPPPKPEQPGPFQAYNINGRDKGKFHCVVTSHGLQPLVLIFIRGADSDPALVSLLKKLDPFLRRYDKLATFAVYLNNDILDDDKRTAPDTKLDELLNDDNRRDDLEKQLNEALLKKHGINHERLIIGLYCQSGPKGYDIGKDSEITVLLRLRHRDVEKFKFKKGEMKEENVNAIMAGVERLVQPTK